MSDDFDFETERVKELIKKKRAKRVLIQLPDGLKPFATRIVDELEKTGAEIIIWLGSNYGACDPAEPKRPKIDLIIHYGHQPP